MKEFRIFPPDIVGFPMKQYEAVIEVMQNNRGYATLGELYKKAFKIANVKWGTKTPLASIRRIVQDERYFFKIKPGLWALKSQKENVLNLFELNKGKTEGVDVFNHSYYQGLLLEIGNFKNLKTFVPAQDKNKKFLEKPLGTIASINSFYQFSYKEIINRAKSIDVSWFNERKFPHSFFEVEHSTDFKNSLLKFVELQDFNTEFRIVADIQKEKQFNSIITMAAFKPIEHRVKFLSYDLLAELHAKTIELVLVESTWNS